MRGAIGDQWNVSYDYPCANKKLCKFIPKDLLIRDYIYFPHKSAKYMYFATT